MDIVEADVTALPEQSSVRDAYEWFEDQLPDIRARCVSAFMVLVCAAVGDDPTYRRLGRRSSERLGPARAWTGILGESIVVEGRRGRLLLTFGWSD